MELNVLAMYKGDEKYIFIYDDRSRDALITNFRNQAANPECNLNWFDVSVLTRKMDEQTDPAIATLERVAPQSP